MNCDVLIGDATEKLRTLPAESVHCVVTSPPYFGLRDYDVDGQIGLEPTIGEYLRKLVDVFREIRRVLRSDGTCFANMGDAYNGHNERAPSILPNGQYSFRAGSGPKVRVAGLKAKDLIGMPWRLALALQDDGWYLRQDIIWNKINPCPESVADRCTKSHEYIFLLSKSEQYFFDAEAIKEKASTNSHGRGGGVNPKAKKEGQHSRIHVDRDPRHAKKDTGVGWGRLSKLSPGNTQRERDRIVKESKQNPSFAAAVTELVTHRNKRSVWTFATSPYREAHFACVDSNTEALTPDGWRDHEDLQDGDLIAAYDREQKQISWQPATFNRYPFSGDLVVIEKRDSSQRLTAQHRCLISRRIRGESVVEAASLKPGMKIPLTAPLIIPESNGVGPEFAALLGWYVSEGEKRQHRILINQSLAANPTKVAQIRSILLSLGADFTESTRKREWRGRPADMVVFTIKGVICDRLHEFSPCKSISLSWLAWPKSDIQAFLDAVDGDGHRRKDDNRSSIIQKSRDFLDAIQMLALRLGKCVAISPKQDGGSVAYLTDRQWLTLRGTNGKHKPLDREHYEGTVWCPTVLGGFWLARRRGRTFITGNTFPVTLPDICIRAGTSERGCCAVCGRPLARIVETFETGLVQKTSSGWEIDDGSHGSFHHDGREGRTTERPIIATRTIGWESECCPLFGGAVSPCVVLDPFAGAGTTALAALRLGRSCILIDIDPKNVPLIEKRLRPVLHPEAPKPRRKKVPKIAAPETTKDLSPASFR